MRNKNQTKENWEKEFVEKGADLEHMKWVGWQSYLSKSEWTKNGYLIPKELCIKWQKQIDTPYSKLSEEEKESDRIEVRKYLPLIRRFLKSEKKELLEKIEEIIDDNNDLLIRWQKEELKDEIKKELKVDKK